MSGSRAAFGSVPIGLMAGMPPCPVRMVRSCLAENVLVVAVPPKTESPEPDIAAAIYCRLNPLRQRDGIW